MLACPHPPGKATSLNGAEGKLLEAVRSLAAERRSIDPTAYRRRALHLWGCTRDIILKLDRPRGAALLRETAEMINGVSVGLARSSRPGGTHSKVERSRPLRIALKL
jgi:hypothetical protein